MTNYVSVCEICVALYVSEVLKNSEKRVGKSLDIIQRQQLQSGSDNYFPL